MDLPESETVALRRDALLPPTAATVRWRRSARARRVSLRVCPVEGAVVVTLPPRGSRRAGLELLRDNASWVLRRLDKLAPPTELRDGATVPIGGAPHRLRHDPTRKGMAFLEAGELVVTGQEEFLARRALAFLRAEAARRVAAALPPHCEALGVRPRAVRVKDTKSRWGSCAADRTLAFSWRLVLAPPWVLDYVVAHEACHLRELNHSHRFWALVDARAPQREAAERWLRQNGPGLLRVGQAVA